MITSKRLASSSYAAKAAAARWPRPFDVLPRFQGAARLASQHDVRTMIRAGFQEHRIHRRFGRDTGGLRLQVLRAADLSAIAADTGIVRHVLRLERRDRNASARQRAAQAGDDQRLARVGGRAGDQDTARLHPHRSPPAQCTACPQNDRCLLEAVGLCLAYICRYPIVTYSGVVVRDEGTVTGTGLRIASASAAVVVSAAVVGAALYGGSAISDPRAPADQDQRLVAIPATPSPYPTATPSRFSRAPRASAHARPECQRLEKPAVCHREKQRPTATRSTTSQRTASNGGQAASSDR